MFIHRVLEREPAVLSLGLGVQHFPRYVNQTLRLHGVDVVLLTFILKGRGHHVIGDETFPETGASLSVTHYGQQHDVLTDETGMEIINVYLDLQRHALPSLPRALQSILPLWLPLHPRFQHRLNRIVRLQFEDPAPFAEPLFAIARELAARELGYEESVALQFKLFLIRCCRHALTHGVVPSRQEAAVPASGVEEARRFIDANYAQPLTLEELAGCAGLTRTSLCRAFKAYTGKRVFDYLIERRIQAAMVRLRAGDEKVLAIALECGFQDLAYFNRKFRQIVGSAPTTYRIGAQ